MIGSGKLVVKGEVKGNIKAQNILIEEQGSVNGDLRAGQITIAGKFTGTLYAMEQLSGLSSGQCSGKVSCKSLQVESGGLLKAGVEFVESDASKAASG